MASSFNRDQATERIATPGPIRDSVCLALCGRGGWGAGWYPWPVLIPSRVRNSNDAGRLVSCAQWVRSDGAWKPSLGQRLWCCGYLVAGDECAGYSGGGGISCTAERVVAPIAFVYCPVPLLVILAFAVFIGSLASFIFVLEATRICVVEILRYE